MEKDPRWLCRHPMVDESDHTWDEAFTLQGMLMLPTNRLLGMPPLNLPKSGARAFLDGIGADYLKVEE